MAVDDVQEIEALAELGIAAGMDLYDQVEHFLCTATVTWVPKQLQHLSTTALKQGLHCLHGPPQQQLNMSAT
jgi:hypothetical protein